MNAWTSNGRPVSPRTSGHLVIRTSQQHPQAAKLDALIRTAMQARHAAERGEIFDSAAGKAFLLAAHDLLEIDEIYELAQPIDREITRDGMNEDEGDMIQGRRAR